MHTLYKHYFFRIFLVLIVWCTILFQWAATPVFGAGTIENTEITSGMSLKPYPLSVDSGYLHIHIEMVLSGRMLNTRGSLILIPELSTKDSVIDLPQVILAGRRSKNIFYRNRYLGNPRPEERPYRIIRAHRSNVRFCHYLVKVPYQSWMASAKLYVREITSLYGDDKRSLRYALPTVRESFPTEPEDSFLDNTFDPETINAPYFQPRASRLPWPTEAEDIYWKEVASRDKKSPEKSSAKDSLIPPYLLLNEIYGLLTIWEKQSPEHCSDLLRQALRYYPHDPLLRINASAYALEAGEIVRANTLLEGLENIAAARNNQGVVALLDRQYTTARRCFVSALQDNAEARYNLEQLITSQGE